MRGWALLLAVAACRFDVDRLEGAGDDGPAAADAREPGDGAATPLDGAGPDASLWAGGTWCQTMLCETQPCCTATWQCDLFCAGESYWCDGPEDCPGNGECCLTEDVAACSNNACPASQLEICHVDGDCDFDEICVADASRRMGVCQ